MLRASVEVIRISAGRDELRGALLLPTQMRGIVLVTLQGTGSAQAAHLVRHLRDRGFGTLLMPLLTLQEELEDARTAEHSFNIRLLAQRILDQITAVEARLNGLVGLGVLATGTAAAGALAAAAKRPEAVSALVLQGGRPELAVFALGGVEAPTLLLAGGADEPGIHSNEIASMRLRAPYQLEVVDGAGHRFEEPGKLVQAAELAADWFGKHLEPLLGSVPPPASGSYRPPPPDVSGSYPAPSPRVSGTYRAPTEDLEPVAIGDEKAVLKRH